MHPTVRAAIKPVEEKKEKKDLNTLHVGPPRLLVKIKGKVILGVRKQKSKWF
jgi:hypothetical protein